MNARDTYLAPEADTKWQPISIDTLVEAAVQCQIDFDTWYALTNAIKQIHNQEQALARTLTTLCKDIAL